MCIWVGRDCVEQLRPVLQSNCVHPDDARVERRVVRDDQRDTLACTVEGIVEPMQSFAAKPPRVVSGGVGRPVKRVQGDHAVGRQVAHVLHKSVVVGRAVELIKECVAPVMVAKHRDHGDWHIFHDFRQPRVLIVPPVVRQITHQHNRFGVIVVGQRMIQYAL